MGDDLRFVFDTNVILGAAIRPGSAPMEAISRARSIGRLLVSDATLAELTEVLSRPRLDRYVELALRMSYLASLIADARVVEPWVMIRECRDPDDDKFLEVAVSGVATCLVTGDNDLLVLHPFRDIPILKPRAFLDAVW